MEFKNTKEELWMNTEKLDGFSGRAKEFDSIFIVGGFGRKRCVPHVSIPSNPFAY